jgi:RND family efflux transporter MFP subunit
MRHVVHVLIVLAVLVGAGLATAALYATKPAPNRVSAPRLPPLVEVHTAVPAPVRASITGRGTLSARTPTTLTAQVGGVVTWVADGLRPGQRLPSGTDVVLLDTADLDLAAARAAADLAAAEARRDQEAAQAAQALAEWTAATTDPPPALAVRAPQLAELQARVAAAAASLAQARLDRGRARLAVPADAWVVERLVEPGQQVARGTVIARLMGPDLEAAVDIDDADLALLPDLPVDATLTVDGAQRAARIVRLDAQRDTRTRSRRAYLEAGAVEGVWLPGAYVELGVAGRDLGAVTMLPDQTLIAGDAVWTVVDDCLRRTPVTVVRAQDDGILVSGLMPGALVVTTRLETATDGMAVRRLRPESP